MANQRKDCPGNILEDLLDEARLHGCEGRTLCLNFMHWASRINYKTIGRNNSKLNLVLSKTQCMRLCTILPYPSQYFLEKQGFHSYMYTDGVTHA